MIDAYTLCREAAHLLKLEEAIPDYGECEFEADLGFPLHIISPIMLDEMKASNKEYGWINEPNKNMCALCSFYDNKVKVEVVSKIGDVSKVRIAFARAIPIL